MDSTTSSPWLVTNGVRVKLGLKRELILNHFDSIDYQIAFTRIFS